MCIYVSIKVNLTCSIHCGKETLSRIKRRPSHVFSHHPGSATVHTFCWLSLSLNDCNNFLPFFSTVSLKATLQFRDPLKEETRDTGNFGNQGIRVLHHLITILVRARKKKVYSKKGLLAMNRRRSFDRPWKRSQKFFISLSLHSKFRNKRGQVFFSVLKRFWCVFVMSRPRRLLHTYSREFFLVTCQAHTRRTRRGPLEDFKFLKRS